jgi:hypothetical protein
VAGGGGVTDKKYNVVYADPPWSYKSQSGRGFRHAAKHKYDTMSLEDIKALPVPQVCQKNAVLFLWVTVPLLQEGLEVLNAWGFKYKTMISWRKVRSLGMGFWFRGQCEHLILGVRGGGKAFPVAESKLPPIDGTKALTEAGLFPEADRRGSKGVVRGAGETGVIRSIIGRYVSRPSPARLGCFWQRGKQLD